MLTRLKSNYLFFIGQYILLFVSLFTSISACSNKQSGPQITGNTMGTNYSIQWHDYSGAIKKDALHQEIIARLKHINALMSTYITDSQLSEFNQSTETGWHAVDIELARIVDQALKLCRQSEGAFDITVGPLVNLWGFGASEVNFQFPTATEINIAMRSVGCQNLQAKLSPPAINKQLADIYIDLSAIAKGYAVDQLATILDNHSIKHYMIEIGGEVKAKGIAAHGDPWRIGIQTPDSQYGNIEEVISLQDIAIATSGDYRNYFEHKGQRYSHSIDPRTGYPVNHQIASVTIIHDSTAMADAWATAFMVLNANKTLDIAKNNGLSGLLVTRHGKQYQTTYFGEISYYLVQ